MKWKHWVIICQDVYKRQIVNIETWIKNDDAATKELLKKGSLIKLSLIHI